MARRFEDKFDLILRAWRDRTNTIILEDELQQQLDRWVEVRTWLLEHPGERDRFYLDLIKDEFDCQERTAWQCLADARRFFAATEAVNREFEKVMQLAEIRQDIYDLKAAKKYKELLAARKLLASITGTDREDPNAGGLGSNVIINLITYNPELIGAKTMAIDDLDKMIADILADDQLQLEQGLR